MPIIGIMFQLVAVAVDAITIGNNVKIGANCYVDRDFSDNLTVVGNPARKIDRSKGQRENCIYFQQTDTASNTNLQCVPSGTPVFLY